MEFRSSLKKAFEETKTLHRFIHQNTPFYEDAIGIDQKNYNNLQVGVLRKIAELKFGGDIQQFIIAPEGKKVMAEYREFVKQNLPFLLQSPNNPSFDYKNEELINKAVQFICNKVFPARAMTASF